MGPDVIRLHPTMCVGPCPYTTTQSNELLLLWNTPGLCPYCIGPRPFLQHYCTMNQDLYSKEPLLVFTLYSLV